MELGCFLAGAMISGQGLGLAEQIEHIIQPIKDFLGCIFFVSIGEYPHFISNDAFFQSCMYTQMYFNSFAVPEHKMC